MLPAAIENFNRGMAPARPEEIITFLTRLSMNVQLPEMSPAAWEIHLDDFVSDLSEYPADIINAGCTKWRKEKIFFPKISEFLSFVEPMLKRRQIAARRLKTLKAVSDNPAPNGVLSYEWYLEVMGNGHGIKRRGGSMRTIGDLINNS